MGADYVVISGEGDEAWSNWICPACNNWPGSLEEGWKEAA
jgi:hypothetical protein